jgi:hypothetical protein
MGSVDRSASFAKNVFSHFPGKTTISLPEASAYVNNWPEDKASADVLGVMLRSNDLTLGSYKKDGQFTQAEVAEAFRVIEKIKKNIEQSFKMLI